MHEAPPQMLARLAALEEALADYALLYGLTDRARAALAQHTGLVIRWPHGAKVDAQDRPLSPERAG